MIEYLGFLAATFTTIAFVPQFYQTWKSKSAKDINLSMFVLFSTGILLWLIYGIFIKSYPIIMANSLTLVLSLGILYFKLRYK